MFAELGVREGAIKRLSLTPRAESELSTFVLRVKALQLFPSPAEMLHLQVTTSLIDHVSVAQRKKNTVWTLLKM